MKTPVYNKVNKEKVGFISLAIIYGLHKLYTFF